MRLKSERFHFLYCTRAEASAETIEGSIRVQIYTSVPELQRTLEEAGVKNDDHWVVCYGDSGVEEAAEVWWLLSSLGRANTAVLAGGLAQWIATGLPVTAHQPLTVSLPPSESGYSLVQAQLVTAALPHSQVIHTLVGSAGDIYFDPDLGLRADGSLETPDLILDLLELSGVDMNPEIVKVVKGPKAGVALLMLTCANVRRLAMFIDESRLEDCEGQDQFHSIPQTPLFLSFLLTNDPEPLPPVLPASFTPTPSTPRPPAPSPSRLSPLKPHPKQGATDTCVQCTLL